MNNPSFYLNLSEETLLYSQDSITRNGNAFSFGTLAPGETSETLILQLKVSNALAIKNIQIALVDSGGMAFKNNIFGVDILNYLDLSYKPQRFFQGINTTKNFNSSYNINVTNQTRILSNFVYLNVSIPEEYPEWEGTTRYGWFYNKG